MYEGKTILVAPLDWGLGHSSRCVPLIKQLSLRNTVILGVTTATSEFLNSYFPELEKTDLPAYKITYNKNTPQWLTILAQLPRIAKVIRDEHRVTLSLVQQKGINIIVSDNRYGVYDSSVTSILLCHQVDLQLPLFSRLVNRMHRRLMRLADNRAREC